MSWFSDLLNVDNYMPHGHCYLWDKGLVSLHVVSDSLIFLSYMIIPLILLSIVRKRKDIPFDWMLLAFSVFIVACGFTHLMDIITLWIPYYWVDGGVKAVTALASISTAIALFRLAPSILTIPSPAQLQSVNDELEKEVVERRKAEQEIAYSKANLLSLIETAADPIWSMDPECRLITFNSAYKEFIQSTYGIVVEEGFDPLPLLTQEEQEVWRRLMDRALADESFRHELILNIRNKEHIIEFSFNPITNNGKVTGVSIFGRDITQRKQMELDLVHAKNTAEEMNKLKSTFLANMSHEIRTPMTAILGFATEIEDETEEVETKKFASIIQQSGERLLSTINGILDLAKIESGQYEPEFEAVSVDHTVDVVVNQLRSLARTKKLTLEVEHRAERSIVKADRYFLERVLINLIGNALKFTEQGSVCVKTETRTTSEGSFAVLHVIDTGIGISKNFLPDLFKPFQQESTGYDRRFEGTGLGLSITKALVEQMDGKISVTSEVGKGSHFIVEIPLTNESIKRGNAPTSADLDRLDPVISPLNILLVEDTKETAQLVRNFLQSSASFDHASDAVSALQLVNQHNYDVILMDVNLGDGMSGIEISKVIKKIERYKSVPIIAVTAYAMKEEEMMLMASGFDSYLSKPFKKAELFKAIENVVRLKKD